MYPAINWRKTIDSLVKDQVVQAVLGMIHENITTMG